MEWRHLKEVLNRYGELLAVRYKSYVPEGTGKLVQSVKFDDVKVDGDSYIVELNLEKYWHYVENGRKAGKFPPVGNIKEWIKMKPVLPRPLKNGKLPTEKQLAFLIGRKIANEGTQGKHIMDRTVEEVNNEMLMSIKMAMLEDVALFAEKIIFLIK